MLYKNLFNGSAFHLRGDDTIYWKVGNAYAIGKDGSEHIFGLFDKVEPIPVSKVKVPNEKLNDHLEWLHFGTNVSKEVFNHEYV